MTHTVSIKPISANQYEVLINGTDFADIVLSVDAHLSAEHPPRITLELNAASLFSMDQVSGIKVDLVPAVVTLLTELGWTPPKEET